MNRQIRAIAAIVLIAISLEAGSASAAVTPSALFSDNAVLLADHEVPVWGWDEPGQTVTVTVAQAKATGAADKDGRWEVKLPAMKASDTPLEMIIAGSSTVTVKNVLVGEVWVGSGQSNMAMPVDWGVFGAWGTPECMKGINEANYPKLRLFKVQAHMAGEPPAKDVSGVWQICTPTTIVKWSAAGYFFGRELQKELGGAPVGIINSSLGGTQILPWAINRKSALELNPKFNDKTQEQWARDAKKMEEFDAQMAAWSEAAAKAKQSGAKEPEKPKRTVAAWPSSLYNGMIAPLVPYSVRGITWYQGESNTGASAEESYARTFETLVKIWRSAWNQPELPFIIVQLPNFSAPGNYISPNSKPVQADPVEADPHWPPIREAQRRTAAALPNTGLLVAIDIGDPKNIHPTNKQEIGRRWALLAMNLVYGKKDLVASGPLLAGCEFKDGKAIAKFTGIGGGMTAKGDGEIKGFRHRRQRREICLGQRRHHRGHRRALRRRREGTGRRPLLLGRKPDRQPDQQRMLSRQPV